MSKPLTTFLLVVIFGTASGFAQKWKLSRHEVHFGIGTINVFGDIGGTASTNNMWGLKDIRLNETGISLYGGARYKLSPKMALKMNLIYGIAKGSDVGSRNEERAFSYKTSIFEPSIQYEYYFLKEDRENRGASLYNRRGQINNFNILAAYGFIGLGGVMLKPEFSYSGRQPNDAIEKTDGYGSFSAAIPVGVGIKTTINKNWAFGIEIGRRIVFSDYLDGFSTSFSTHNDTYYFGMLHAIYRLESDRYGRLLLFKRSRMPNQRR